MKKIIATAAIAASCIAASNICSAKDLLALPNWSGPYIGITGGMSNSTIEALPPFDTSLIAPFSGNVQTGNAPSEGVVIGYDHQMGQLVLGVLAEVNHTNIITSGKWFEEGGSGNPWGTQLDWLGSVRARVGVTSHDILFYGTGGIAFTNGKIAHWNYENFGDNSFAFDSVGYVFGGGAEIMIAPKWTASIDLSHYTFSQTNNTQEFSDEFEGVGQIGGRNRLTADVVKIGINYRF